MPKRLQPTGNSRGFKQYRNHTLPLVFIYLILQQMIYTYIRILRHCGLFVDSYMSICFSSFMTVYCINPPLRFIFFLSILNRTLLLSEISDKHDDSFFFISLSQCNIRYLEYSYMRLSMCLKSRV